MKLLEDVKKLKEWLEENDCLGGYNKDLIDDAIIALECKNTFRADRDLSTLAFVLRKSDQNKAASKVEKIRRN